MGEVPGFSVSGRGSFWVPAEGRSNVRNLSRTVDCDARSASYSGAFSSSRSSALSPFCDRSTGYVKAVGAQPAEVER